MQIDSDTYYVNGEERKLDVPASIINGRTMVPVRAVSEGLGCQVKWENDTKTVIVETVDITAETTNLTGETTTEVTTEATTISETTTSVNYKTVYKEGKYIIGQDIPEGEYIVFAEGDIGYLNNNESYFVGKGVMLQGQSVFEGNSILNLKKNNYYNPILYIGSNTSGFSCNNVYVVPSSEVKMLDTSYNGTFRVGTDIPTGSYTFKKAEGHNFGFVKIDGSGLEKDNRGYYVKDSISIKLTKGEYIQVINCDISSAGREFSVHKDRAAEKINEDFSDITPELKAACEKTFNSIITKYENNYETGALNIDNITNDWKSLSKTKADEEYIKILTEALYKCKTYAENKLYSNAEIKEMSNPEYGVTLSINAHYFDMEEMVKDIAQYYTDDLRSVVEADSFESLSEANSRLNAYCFKFLYGNITEDKKFVTMK